MDPQALSGIALIVALVSGGIALYQQRSKGIRTDSTTQSYWQQRAEGMAADLADLRTRIRETEQGREVMEDSFQRQVATLLAQLTETRSQLQKTQIELAATVAELDRLRLSMAGPVIPTPARRIRVLGIWPDTELDPLSKEGSALDNAGISYQGLTGTVTRRDILRELRRSQGNAGGYNVIHVGSHGQESDPAANQIGGILLSHGDLTPPGWWGQVAGANSIQMAVLMVCEGDDVADALRRAGVVGVVAASRELADRAAVAFSWALYENLAEGMGLADAVRQATWVLSSDQAGMIRLIGGDPWAGGGKI